MTTFKKLFEMGKIGNLEVRNRIIFPPMVTLFMDEKGAVTDRLIDHYAERAKGGAGIIVTEAAYPRASGYPGRIYLNDDKYISGLARLTEAIHQNGAKAICEINPHRGRADEHDPASASAAPHPFKAGVMAREVTYEDIKSFIESFGQGVRRAKEAGYDGVMIHGATGYLISEFLSPMLNQRTDEYGGNIKGRARFALELVQMTRQIAGPNYPLIFRIVADEKISRGFSVTDAIALCDMLQQSGVDAIDVTVGGQDSPEWSLPPSYFPAGCNADISQEIKRNLNIPVIVVGKINDPFVAEEILRLGKADFVSMGRALIADPFLPQKAMNDEVIEIRKCIACQRCSESIIIEHEPLVCSVNPTVGNEREFCSKMRPATKKKRVLVVGGGPAGLETAIIAAQRGHEVSLWEADDKLGGQLCLAVIPPGKNDLNSLIEYFKTQIAKLNIIVEMQKKATLNDIREFAPDTVIVATGSIPCLPKIKGIDGKAVVDARQVLAGEITLGYKVVIIGGGLIGCETADFLAERGKSVIMTFPETSPMSLEIHDRSIVKVILERLNKGKVEILAGIKRFQEITTEGVKVINKDGNEQFIRADSIIVATGSSPDRSLAISLKGSGAELYEVGDCLEVHRIKEAINGGARVALEI